MFKVGIITASDKGYGGEREDLSGKKIMDLLPKDKYAVIDYKLLPDEEELLSNEMINMSDELGCDLVLTTGGTGFSKRDITPEATLKIATRNASGIAEAIRMYSIQITKRAMLSRGVSVIRNNTLIINLPGSVKAVEESLTYILDTLFHGLEILLGQTTECGRQ
ncbi:MAG: MogA/MoaB family molybdenum cofactor biosynthesis protein [Lachnospiraceae bacterium]|jgi:molybdenum cofactor synthesis domain-containing protein|nr:MogA/MoaB family molybdenum cofactor biosynthesis protein [Lachnospiraceae bacterium]